jgi:hypothetical protein
LADVIVLDRNLIVVETFLSNGKKVWQTSLPQIHACGECNSSQRNVSRPGQPQNQIWNREEKAPKSGTWVVNSERNPINAC